MRLQAIQSISGYFSFISFGSYSWIPLFSTSLWSRYLCILCKALSLLSFRILRSWNIFFTLLCVPYRILSMISVWLYTCNHCWHSFIFCSISVTGFVLAFFLLLAFSPKLKISSFENSPHTWGSLSFLVTYPMR